MRLFRGSAVWSVLLAGVMVHAAAPRKPHVVGLGLAKSVAYSKAGDPAGAGPGETALKVRPLVVDGRVAEWTTGDAHDVTDRSFVVRRALRINDSLPDSAPANSLPVSSPPDDKLIHKKPVSAEPLHWVWQRGPWLMVDRVTGHVTALKLPDYDPGVSQVAWFRDYGAYCGVTSSGKNLYAVVAQIGVRRPVLAKKLEGYDAEGHPWPVCGVVDWQREPLRVTFHPTGREAASFDLVRGSAVLVEEDDEPETASKP